VTDENRSADAELIRSVWEEARDLVKRLEGSTVVRFAVQAGDTRIEIERGTAGAPVVAAGALPAAAAGGAPAEAAAADEPDDRHPILAPLVGTFYSAPQPGADPFVKEGDIVDVGQTVGIVEAMKLMNQVQADRAGKVSAIVVEDGQWVEFEQVLVLLEPLDAEG
jgi:acetyl-CoA carboxylase biotin carboxyl carrier protein